MKIYTTAQEQIVDATSLEINAADDTCHFLQQLSLLMKQNPEIKSHITNYFKDCKYQYENPVHKLVCKKPVETISLIGNFLNELVWFLYSEQTSIHMEQEEEREKRENWDDEDD